MFYFEDTGYIHEAAITNLTGIDDKCLYCDLPISITAKISNNAATTFILNSYFGPLKPFHSHILYSNSIIMYKPTQNSPCYSVKCCRLSYTMTSRNAQCQLINLWYTETGSC